MRRADGSDTRWVSGAELLLLLAGGALSAGSGFGVDCVLDARAESGCPDPLRAPLSESWGVPVLLTVTDDKGPIPDGAALWGRPPISVPVGALEAVRSAALGEIGRRAIAIRGAVADVGGVPHDLDATSREEWVYLAVGALLHRAIGSPGDFYGGLGYLAADGSPQALPDLETVAARYLGLLDVARERRLAALAAHAAVLAARDGAEIVAALEAYPV